MPFNFLLVEVVNPALLERNRNRRGQGVMDELNQTYEKLTAKLNSMTFEDMLKPRHADDPEKRPLLLWILGDTTERFSGRRETI